MSTIPRLTAIRRTERGGTLLEVLVSLVIFSIGVLGIVGLQATAARNSGESKYRADAALLTDQLIAQMWTSNVALSGVLSGFSTSGAISSKVSTWRTQVAATLPAGTGTVNVIDATAGLVSVTVCWQAPAAPQHCHTTTAQVRLNS